MWWPRRGGEHGVRGCRSPQPAGSGSRPAKIAAFLPLLNSNVLDQASDDVDENGDDWMRFVDRAPAPRCDRVVARAVQGLATGERWTRCANSKLALACAGSGFSWRGGGLLSMVLGVGESGWEGSGREEGGGALDTG